MELPGFVVSSSIYLPVASLEQKEAICIAQVFIVRSLPLYYLPQGNLNQFDFFLVLSLVLLHILWKQKTNILNLSIYQKIIIKITCSDFICHK